MSDFAPLPVPATPPNVAWTPARLAFALALLPAAVAVLQLGRLHPDEVYQSLEPAFHRAYGFGILAWEWQSGLRNWSVPIFFSVWLKAGDAWGIHDPQARRALLELPVWALHAAMLLAVHRLAERRLGARRARTAMAMVGAWFLVVTWAGRTMSESFSAGFLVWALERLDLKGKPRDAALAGMLLGCAVVARYGSAAFVVGALLWLLVQRRWKDFGVTSAAGLTIALALGWLDAATWGDWWHSLRVYLNFNVFTQGSAAQFGAAPWWFFLPHLGWLAPWAWPGLISGVRLKTARFGLFVFPAAVYVAAISATAHKEVRFLYPALVLLGVAGTIGTLALLDRPLNLLPRRALLALCWVGLVAPYFAPTPFDVERPEQFRLLVKAGREATGLIIANEGIWGSGGFFYLGKNIPWFNFDLVEDPRLAQALADRRFNRAVTWDQRANSELLAGGFKVLEVQGQATLLGR